MTKKAQRGFDLRRGPGKRKGFDDSGETLCTGCFQKKLEIDRLKAENQRLRERQCDFDKLSIALREAKKELRRLEGIVERTQAIGSTEGAHTPPSQRRFKNRATPENIAKRGGGSMGHKGHGRRRIGKAQADRLVVVPAPSLCPECQHNLKLKEYRERVALDIEHVPVQKTVYRFERKQCPRCGKLYQGQASVAPRALYGNSLLAKMLVMHFVHGTTIGKLCKILGDGINPGGVVAAFHRVAARFEPALDPFKAMYRGSKVKHADETGWRVDGQTGWAWLFCTRELSIFQHALSRSRKVVDEILGHQPVPGVLVVDRFNAYNRAPCSIQYCYAHLLREVKKLDRDFPDSEEVIEFSRQFAALLVAAMKLPVETLSHSDFRLRVTEIVQQIRSFVAAPARHQAIVHIQNIFRKGKSRLYQWATSRSIPAHNNFAEREIRRIVIARKVSLGSQSENGARSRSILASVLMTAEKNLGPNSLELWTQAALNDTMRGQRVNVANLIPFPRELFTHIH